jgi:hypothetical protein
MEASAPGRDRVFTIFLRETGSEVLEKLQKSSSPGPERTGSCNGLVSNTSTHALVEPLCEYSLCRHAAGQFCVRRAGI